MTFVTSSFFSKLDEFCLVRHKACKGRTKAKAMAIFLPKKKFHTCPPWHFRHMHTVEQLFKFWRFQRFGDFLYNKQNIIIKCFPLSRHELVRAGVYLWFGLDFVVIFVEKINSKEEHLCCCSNGPEAHLEKERRFNFTQY